jgi:hypothetical protein
MRCVAIFPLLFISATSTLSLHCAAEQKESVSDHQPSLAQTRDATIREKVPQEQPRADPPAGLGSTGQAPKERLVPVFMPSLASLLLNREQKKGMPLTREEVLEIRDRATVVMVPESNALTIEERRGYQDIDPRRCWEEWQAVRPQLQHAQ